MTLISSIKIGDRHRKDMGDLQTLADSIRAQGLLQPIGITTENELVFGERRLRACRDILGWTQIETRVVNVTSIVEGEQEENEIRKDFTPSERVAIAEAVRKALGNRQGQRTDQLPDGSPEVKGKETREIAAEKAGFTSDFTYRQAKTVVEEGIPELVEKMDAGEVSVSAAAIIAKQDKEVQQRIVADPDVKKAVSELREAQKSLKEAEALPKAAPITADERARREEVFGTVESRAVFMDVLGISEKVASFPDPFDAAQRIPPALQHSFNAESFRAVARWFDDFCNAYEAREIANVAAQ